MSVFDDIFNEITTKSHKLIKDTLAESVNEAHSDVKKFLILSKAKLNRYAKQFANGEISKDELEWLIESQSNLLEMKKLEQTGLEKVRVHIFKRKLLKIITKAVIGKVL